MQHSSWLRRTWRAWIDDAVRSRLRIIRLIPSGGVGIVGALVVLYVVLGLLPVVFIYATSVVIGLVPQAVADGSGSPAWTTLVTAFLWAAAVFLIQHLLTPVQMALGDLVHRRIDAVVRDRLVAVSLRYPGIAVLEDPQALNELAEARRNLDREWATPGGAGAGMLALIARYIRLVALVVIIGLVVNWWAAVGVFAVTMLFRYGQRGGTRIYSRVWRAVMPDIRRSEYFYELGVKGGAAKELRIFGLTSWMADRFGESHSKMFGLVAKRRRQIYFFPYLGYTLVGSVVISLVMWLVVQDGLAAQTDLTALALTLQCVVAAVLLGEHYPEADVDTQFGMQAVDALQRFTARAEELDQRQRVLAANASSGPAALPRTDRPLTVTFEQVRFAYPGSDRPVLAGLDLELEPGKSTAVVGVNGAGKTTTVKLLTRLYQPDAGRILAGGVDIANLDVAEWRKRVSVIFQDFVRYEVSAADNIAFGAIHATPSREQIADAAERAGIAAVLEALPNSYDTVLSRGYEGGVDLSGGQWQRVAIARSLFALQQGAQVLVLDEPTSAMDVRAEAAFFDRFVELTRGATSLLISHRFSSVRRADRIVVVDGGQVVESGSHTKLMRLDGHYARLFRLQAERFAKGLNADGELDEPTGTGA